MDVNRSGNHHSASRRACARTFGASGLILLLTTSGVRSADSATHQGSEIRVREIEPATAAQVSYARQIKPIFASNCLDCHSPEEQKAGLDASSVPSLVKGGKKAGPAIVPGKPDDSPLVQYLRGLREPQMPKGSPALSEEELHLIRQWIFAGARDDSASVAVEGATGDPAGAGGQASPAADDPGTQKALNDLLFSANNQDRLLAQRRLRLALLTKPPEPPNVKGPVFNPVETISFAHPAT